MIITVVGLGVVGVVGCVCCFFGWCGFFFWLLYHGFLFFLLVFNNIIYKAVICCPPFFIVQCFLRFPQQYFHRSHRFQAAVPVMFQG